MDWQPDAVGEEAFAKPAQGTSFYYTLRKALEKKGYSVRHWNRAAHRPWLLTLKTVHSWEDFKHWLGFGLPRQKVLENETRHLIVSGLGPHLRDLNIGRISKNQLILFTWEPPAVQCEIWEPKIQKLFHKIYTYKDDLIDQIHCFKFYLPFLSPRIEPMIPYEHRKFLTLIASRLSSRHPTELYSQREKLIRFFEDKPEIEFDLYGRYWGKRKFRSWKGAIADKMSILKNYRFAIAYENSSISGYITEKLWDCFAAGVIPIYWGAPNVAEYIPKDCFIDRRNFINDDELLAFLQSMTKEEWKGYVERAEKFLKSDAAQKFTVEHYAATVAEAVDSK